MTTNDINGSPATLEAIESTAKLSSKTLNILGYRTIRDPITGLWSIEAHRKICEEVETVVFIAVALGIAAEFQRRELEGRRP